MSNFIIMIAFAALLVYLVSIGLTIYVGLEKGLKLSYCLIISILLPLFSIFVAAFQKSSDRNILDEMLKRNLIEYDEYQTIEKTIEVKKGNAGKRSH